MCRLNEIGTRTYHKVLAASLEAGIGAGGAKLASPLPFMFEPLVAAPGGPVAVYSAIVLPIILA